MNNKTYYGFHKKSSFNKGKYLRAKFGNIRMMDAESLVFIQRRQ